MIKEINPSISLYSLFHLFSFFISHRTRVSLFASVFIIDGSKSPYCYVIYIYITCIMYLYYFNRMSFGFHRAEVIGALISVLMIWIVTAVLVYMAVLRTIHQEFELDSVIMLISSGFGILVNIM